MARKRAATPGTSIKLTYIFQGSLQTNCHLRPGGCQYPLARRNLGLFSPSTPSPREHPMLLVSTSLDAFCKISNVLNAKI